jgi:GT2 family glycosyltransferase
MADLSIIIVSYKGWERLTRCLEALNSFTGKNFTFEVILVDNRSDDETIFIIEKKFPRFRVIYNTVNGGFANGCNLGSKNASGEFLLFLNPDTVATEAAVEKLLDISKMNPSFGIVSCRQVNERGKESVVSGPFPAFRNMTGFQRALFKGRKTDTARMAREISFPDWISGSVVLIRKELFNKIGGFDEDFWMYYEDVDLSRRIRNLSFEVAFCRELTIEHNHGGSSRINLKTASLTKTEVHVSRHVYVSKHFTGFSRTLTQSFLVFNNIISTGLMALIGLLFFFIPKLFARTLIFFNLIRYYFNSFLRLSWISQRSVNYSKSK